MEQDYQNRIKLVPKFQEGTGNWLTRLFSNKQRKTKKAYDTAESDYLAQNLAARFKDNNLNKDWMSTGEDGKIHVDKTKYDVWAKSDEGKSYIKDFQETDDFKKYRSTWDNYYKQNEQEGLEGIRRFGTDFVDYVNNAVYHDPTEQVAQTNQATNPYREEFRNRINTTFSIPSFSTSPIYTPVSFNPQLNISSPQTIQQETYTPKYSNLNYNQIANWYNNSQRLADLNSFMLQNDSNWQDINSYSDITPEIIDRIYDYQGIKGVSQDGKVGDRTMGRRLVTRTRKHKTPSASNIVYSDVGPYRDGYRGLSSIVSNSQSEKCSDQLNGTWRDSPTPIMKIAIDRRKVITPKPQVNTNKQPARTYSSNPQNFLEAVGVNSWDELLYGI